MQISAQNQDVQGDLYEYLLSRLNTAGQNGQFRTPRHIIRMMVQMIDPRPRERICDPAAGTCGFLVNAWQHILETHTDPRDLSYDEEGYPHGFTGSKLNKQEWEFCQKDALTGYDSDSGMTMLRIGSMNLMLHGIEGPNFRYTDTLSKKYTEEATYDVVLANPPFKGAIDAADVNPTLPVKCKKTEILFLHLFLRLLENGGRGAVIVPDGVLFGSSNAHVEIRKKLIEENRLDGVISMPSGVFRPYAGVSTAVLLFTKGGTTEKIWFYDMEHDGYSLDDKRQKVQENDIPDLLDCWQHRREAKFQQKRAQRLGTLRQQIAPLKKDRLEHHAVIHRLKFEEVVSKATDKARDARERAEAELAELQSRIAPLQQEINQLTRQFWVTKEQVKDNKYDLSASRYRQVEQDDVFYERPRVTLERLRQLEAVASREVATLEEMVSKP
jgi:type I restriction enzyme M protein